MSHAEEVCIEQFGSTTSSFGGGVLSNRLHYHSDLNKMYYSLLIKTTSLVHFTTVHANLIEQTTSLIELVVSKSSEKYTRYTVVSSWSL